MEPGRLHTDYLLMHSPFRFAAASQIDGGSRAYNEGMRPYTDKELRKIRTPLLIEAHGPSRTSAASCFVSPTTSGSTQSRGELRCTRLGFSLRRAAAVRLDIHERELKVGLRVRQDPNGEVIGQIFISDSLENGAGYSSYFGTPVEAESLLRFVVGQTSNTFFGPLIAPMDPQRNPSHGALCRTSCPDCLRDFSNLAYHNILDWRLGLDLARLALDPNAPIDFSVSYWRGLDAAAAGPYFAAMPGWQQVTFGGLQAGRRGNQVEIITHPLWYTDPNSPQLAAAYAQAVAAGGQATVKSNFEVLRRPF